MTTQETKRLTASERESLVRLNVALEILTTEPDLLAARAAMIPGARRDLAMMKSKIERLLGQIVTTVPDDQVRTYINALRMASFTIGARRPGGAGRDDREYGLWLPYEVINRLLEGCHDHCMMCSLDRSARQGCALKKALDTIPNDAETHGDGDCQYYTLI